MPNQDDGRLCAESVPEGIAKDQALVVRTKRINEKALEPMTFEGGIAFVGTEIFF